MIVWYLDLLTTVQLVPITTKVVSLSTADDEMHSMQHYAMKFVGDLRQVDVCLRVFRIPPPIKLTAMILLKYC